MTISPTFDEAGWRADAGALRRLARGLVRDGHEADDVLQEVWLRAGGGESRSRAWLGTTLRNLVRDSARTRARRAAHERSVAREEAVPSATEVLERLEAAQGLARELARLGEPYRLALHLRYFEDLAPEEIAARLGLPRETVRTRLKRGLAELRARLDRTHGGERRAWALALVPFVRTEITGSVGTPLALAGTVGGMLMGTKVVVGATLVAVGAVWIIWSRGRSAETTEASLASRSSSRLAADAAPSALPPQPSSREEVVLTPPAKPAAPAARLGQVEVRVVIEDEHGGELTSESGTLMVGLVAEERIRQAQTHAFEDGRLVLDVPEGRPIVFVRLIARGRSAVLPEPSPIVPAGQALVVRGKWLKRGGLRVIDADSKVELDEVEVRYADGWRANPAWTHPGDHRSLKVLIAHGASPIELPERKWSTPYWVHAPGHAWARIDFDHGVGGERTLELSSARGTVEVTALGAPPTDAHVRLYALGAKDALPGTTTIDQPSFASAVSMSLATSGPTRIEDFEPGRYLAALETGEHEDRVRLGALEFEFVAGETARIAIPLDLAALDVPKTHLVGTLRVPPELVGAREQLRLERLEKEQPDVYLWIGEMDESDDDEALLLWDAGEVRTGTWIANLPHQFRVKFEADVAGGETHVALVMPPLGTVTVEVVEAATGATLVPKRLNWSLAPLEGVSHSTSMSAMRTGPGGAWQIVAPQGTLRIYAQSPGFLEAERELELGPEVAHVRLELVRATGVRVLLREGEASVPIDFSWFYNVEVRDAAGKSTHDTRSLAGEIGSRILPGAGRYTVMFPPLDGFRSLPTQAFDVAEGQVLDLLVPVERE